MKMWSIVDSTFCRHMGHVCTFVHAGSEQRHKCLHGSSSAFFGLSMQITHMRLSSSCSSSCSSAPRVARRARELRTEARDTATPLSRRPYMASCKETRVSKQTQHFPCTHHRFQVKLKNQIRSNHFIVKSTLRRWRTNFKPHGNKKQDKLLSFCSYRDGSYGMSFLAQLLDEHVVQQIRVVVVVPIVLLFRLFLRYSLCRGTNSSSPRLQTFLVTSLLAVCAAHALLSKTPEQLLAN
jgi:hypothetical protein